MSAPALSPPTVRRRGPLSLVLHQLRYEQIAFWRNTFAAAFTIGFSLVFLLLLAANDGNKKSTALGGLRLVQYYVPGFAAYGVMAACFNMLCIALVTRREFGLLKRLRLSPLPTPALLGAIFINGVIVATVQVVVVLVVGRFGFDVRLPHSYPAFIVAIVAGMLTFTALGVAVSTFVPNQDAAGPIVSIVFFVLLFLSGLWFPLRPNSGLAKASAYLPVRHFITAVFAPFDLVPHTSPWSWHDIFVLGIYFVASVLVALRRFSWEPHRA